MDEEVEFKILILYVRRCTLMSRVVWLSNMEKLDLGINLWGLKNEKYFIFSFKIMYKLAKIYNHIAIPYEKKIHIQKV